MTDEMSDDLERVTAAANAAGAEGIWLVRGVTHAMLMYLPQGQQEENLNWSSLNLADTELLVLMRFPAGDGGEPGIEMR